MGSVTARPSSRFLGSGLDTDANWTVTPGSQGLTGNLKAKLTTAGVTSENVIAELIDVVSTDKIVVRLNGSPVPSIGEDSNHGSP